MASIRSCITDGYTVRVIRHTSGKRFLFTASTSGNGRANPKMSAFEWCWSTFSRSLRRPVYG